MSSGGGPAVRPSGGREAGPWDARRAGCVVTMPPRGRAPCDFDSVAAARSCPAGSDDAPGAQAVGDVVDVQAERADVVDQVPPVLVGGFHGLPGGPDVGDGDAVAEELVAGGQGAQQHDLFEQHGGAPVGVRVVAEPRGVDPVPGRGSGQDGEVVDGEFLAEQLFLAVQEPPVVD